MRGWLPGGAACVNSLPNLERGLCAAFCNEQAWHLLEAQLLFPHRNDFDARAELRGRSNVADGARVLRHLVKHRFVGVELWRGAEVSSRQLRRERCECFPLGWHVRKIGAL